MLAEESVVVAEQNVLSSSLEEEVVLLSLKQGLYYSLAATGADIWRMLDKPTTVTAIIATILAQYDAPREQVKADVLALLRDLEREGLLDVHDETAVKRAGSSPAMQPSIRAARPEATNATTPQPRASKAPAYSNTQGKSHSLFSLLSNTLSRRKR